MKKIISAVILLVLTVVLSAQNVDSIKVEQAGDMIKLHYKILNSNQNQTFRVTVTCSINGGLQSIPKNLSGDFGENVTGGRSDYLVLWDVLKDVDEVKSVEFIVRAELVKDANAQSKTKKGGSNTYFILPSVGVEDDFTYGLRLAYMQSWGISAMYMRRTEDYSEYGADYSNVSINTASLDLTKRICNRKKFTMHLFAGILLINDVDHETDFIVHNSLGGEGGFIISANRLAFSTGLGLTETGVGIFHIGLGIQF